jgi:hypothetical protein
MRPLQIGLAIFSAFGLVFAACSQDPGSAATSGSGAGGAPNCTNALNEQDDACYLCVHKECCSQLSVCDAHCVDCFTTIGGTDPTCDATYRALLKCASARCHEGCFHTSGTGAGGATSSSSSG